MSKELSKELIEIAASLLQSDLSDNPEDYRSKMPDWLMYRIEKHNEKLRGYAIRLREESDKQDKIIAEMEAQKCECCGYSLKKCWSCGEVSNE